MDAAHQLPSDPGMKVWEWTPLISYLQIQVWVNRVGGVAGP